MALTDLISNVAGKCGFRATSNVISSTDTTTKQMLAWLQTINQKAMEDFDWPQLLRNGSITFADGIDQYDVAEDFSHHHHDTFWNTSDRWPLYGALTVQEYGDIKGYGVDVASFDQFIIRGLVNTKIEITPIPSAADAGQVVFYLYQSKRYVKPQRWAQGQAVTQGDFTEYNNNFYVAQNTGTTGATAPTHTAETVSDGTINWAFSNAPYPIFLKDTDTPVLPQYIIEQGLIERFNGQKGVQAGQDFESLLLSEFRRRKPASTIAAANMNQTFSYGINGRITFGRLRGLR